MINSVIRSLFKVDDTVTGAYDYCHNRGRSHPAIPPELHLHGDDCNWKKTVHQQWAYVPTTTYLSHFWVDQRPKQWSFLFGRDKERIVCLCVSLFSRLAGRSQSCRGHIEVSGVLSLWPSLSLHLWKCESSAKALLLWTVAKDTKCTVWNEFWRTFAFQPLPPTDQSQQSTLMVQVYFAFMHICVGVPYTILCLSSLLCWATSCGRWFWYYPSSVIYRTKYVANMCSL